MKKFLSRLLKALGLCAAAEEVHTPRADYEPLTIKFLRQIITKDSRTSRVLMWQTEAAEDFLLEYKLVGEEAAHFAEVERRDFICSCAIEKLKPASLYNFRIILGERATVWQKLRTAGDGAFQMIIFSDSQCEHYEVWQRTANAAAENFPDAELVIVNGDLVDNGESDYQWRAFFNAAEKLFADKILAPVMGNHECYGVNWFNALPTGYLKNFALPDNGSKDFGGYFYSFDYGAAHFFVLNTQFDELEKFKPKLQAAQEYFFRRDAANANRRWKIVFMHKDIYSRDKFNDIADKFLELFDELEIDLVFTGHLHTYRNRGKIFARQKSARGTTYILCGRAGDQNYVEKEPESFIALNVDAAEITLTAQTVGGKVLDRFTIRKESFK